jgi:GT2 family glycosyltransferase
MNNLSNNDPLFYVILLNYNNYKYTKGCIESLLDLSYPNFKILVIDDCSSEREIDNLSKDFPTVLFHQNNENKHYCKSFNVGIRIAIRNRADYIFLVNNDTKDFSQNYFEVILNRFKSNKNIGMVGSKCIDYDGDIRRDENSSNRFGIEMDTPTEGYVIKTSVFEKIGLLNEFLIIYMEDLDFIARMRAAGYKTAIDTSISFAHLGGVSTSKEPYKYTFLRVRNIVLFARKMGLDKNLVWTLNQIRANIKSHFKITIKNLIKGNFYISFQIIKGVYNGIKTGYNLKLDMVWNEKHFLL